MKKRKSLLLWVLAFILTIVVIVYQRKTGPTYPIKSVESIGNKEVSYKLLRSFTAFENLPVEVKVSDKEISGLIKYKRYKSDDNWEETEMERVGDLLKAELPGQPVAGKIEYGIRLKYGDKELSLNKGRTIIARFKGEVPDIFLFTHIAFMILGFLFAIRTGLESLRKGGNFFNLVNWTLGIVFVGGMVLGPIVQKYAFGDLWTGIPFGIDLTDNKTLFAFIFWLAAFFLKKRSKWWVLAATVMMIIVYMIPHSALGSELNYKTGKMNNKFSHVMKLPVDSA